MLCSDMGRGRFSVIEPFRRPELRRHCAGVVCGLTERGRDEVRLTYDRQTHTHSSPLHSVCLFTRISALTQ